MRLERFLIEDWSAKCSWLVVEAINVDLSLQPASDMPVPSACAGPCISICFV